VEGRISMSEKELYRLQVLKDVEEKKISVAKAANMLKISTRQLSRIRKSFKQKGAKGLVSKKLGALGNHRIPEEQEKLVLLFFKKEEHTDFGPTLAHEYMVKSLGLKISLSSVRNILIRHNLWVANVKRKKRIHPLRQRRPQNGDLEQIDGSEHDWFEDRGPRCSLLVIVDDATSSIPHAKFVKSENLIDYFYFVREYIELHGVPKAFYSDKHSVFRVNRNPENGAKTQFARAMDELEILLIFANSPQAKGRVERRNKDLQDRLVKALRIAQINSIEAANMFLPTFLKEFNLQFAKLPENPINAHKPAPSQQELDRIFCIKNVRVLSKNLTLQYKGILYQIYSEDQLSLRGAKVDIIESLEGAVRIERKGKALRFVPYGEVEVPFPEVCSKELMDALVPKPKKMKSDISI
jgi:hypothetical protein